MKAASEQKWTEGVIARAVARQTLAGRCVVLVDRCNWTGHECDVLAVTQDLRIIDVEVKISRADLKADAKKDKWWHRQFGRYDSVTKKYVTPPAVLRHWPPLVWKHYYAMPADIWSDDLLSCLPTKNSGVILMKWQSGGVAVAQVVRRATPNRYAERITAAQALDIARLANLRMWDAYQTIHARSTEILEAAQ